MIGGRINSVYVMSFVDQTVKFKVLYQPIEIVFTEILVSLFFCVFRPTCAILALK